jgi:hypothetical protein
MLHFEKTFKDNTDYERDARDRQWISIALAIGFLVLLYYLGNIWVGLCLAAAVILVYVILRNKNRSFITFIEINDPDITIKYTDKNGEHVIYGSKHNIHFRKEFHRYGSILKVIVDGKVFLKQREIGDWTDFDMSALLVAQNPELGMKMKK